MFRRKEPRPSQRARPGLLPRAGCAGGKHLQGRRRNARRASAPWACSNSFQSFTPIRRTRRIHVRSRDYQNARATFSGLVAGRVGVGERSDRLNAPARAAQSQVNRAEEGNRREAAGGQGKRVDRGFNQERDLLSTRRAWRRRLASSGRRRAPSAPRHAVRCRPWTATSSPTREERGNRPPRGRRSQGRTERGSVRQVEGDAPAGEVGTPGVPTRERRFSGGRASCRPAPSRRAGMRRGRRSRHSW